MKGIMDDKTAKMKDLVSKLLRQAEDVVGTPEEAIFQAKAFEVMAKYGLEQADVEADKKGLDASSIPGAIKWEAPITDPYAAQQVLLLHGMAVGLHCKTVWSSQSKVLYVFGVPRHIERLQFLWGVLQPQMLRLVNTVRPEVVRQRLGRRYNHQTSTYETYVRSGSGQVTAYRRAWIAGFAQAVGDRVRQQEEKALEGASSGALVLYRSDTERADVARREVFPHIRHRLGRRAYNHDGYAHGQRDGRSAAFQRAVGR